MQPEVLTKSYQARCGGLDALPLALLRRLR